MCPSPGNIYVHVSFMPAGACLLVIHRCLVYVSPDHIFFFFFIEKAREIYIDNAHLVRDAISAHFTAPLQLSNTKKLIYVVVTVSYLKNSGNIISYRGI